MYISFPFHFIPFYLCCPLRDVMMTSDFRPTHDEQKKKKKRKKKGKKFKESMSSKALNACRAVRRRPRGGRIGPRSQRRATVPCRSTVNALALLFGAAARARLGHFEAAEEGYFCSATRQARRPECHDWDGAALRCSWFCDGKVAADCEVDHREDQEKA